MSLNPWVDFWKMHVYSPKEVVSGRKILFLLVLILLFSSFAFAYATYECNCYNNTLTSTGSTEEIREENCGRNCGGLTTCPSEQEDCPTCCESYCADAGLSSSNAIDGCENSCINTCNSKVTGQQLYEAARTAILVFAAVILSLCGLLFILSDDPETRDKARSCVAYAIVGLVIVGLAVPVIDLLYQITLPAGMPVIGGTGHSDCVALLGDALVDAYEHSGDAKENYNYPYQIIDSGPCSGNVQSGDVETYLEDDLGRAEVANSVQWDAGTVSGQKVCIRADGVGPSPSAGMSSDVDLYVEDVSSSERCKSKQVIDAIGQTAYECWKDHSLGSEGSSEKCDNGLFTPADWNDSVTVTEDYVQSYVYFNGHQSDYVDFQTGSLSNTYSNDVCVKYDTTLGNEILVMDADSDPACSYDSISQYVEEIGQPAEDAWDPGYSNDEVHDKVSVQDWPDGVNVTEEDIEYYLQSETDLDNPPDVVFLSGPISNDWGSEKVCIKYNQVNLGTDSITVAKTSDDSLCSQSESCNSRCGTVCGADECHGFTGLDGASCYFSSGTLNDDCYECDGSGGGPSVTNCTDYPCQESCSVDPCSVSDGPCSWNSENGQCQQMVTSKCDVSSVEVGEIYQVFGMASNLYIQWEVNLTNDDSEGRDCDYKARVYKPSGSGDTHIADSVGWETIAAGSTGTLDTVREDFWSSLDGEYKLNISAYLPNQETENAAIEVYSTTKDVSCTIGSVSISHSLSGSDVEVDVSFENTCDHLCEYKVRLRDSNDISREIQPNFGWDDVDPGGTWDQTLITASSDFPDNQIKVTIEEEHEGQKHEEVLTVS